MLLLDDASKFCSSSWISEALRDRVREQNSFHVYVFCPDSPCITIHFWSEPFTRNPFLTDKMSTSAVRAEQLFGTAILHQRFVNLCVTPLEQVFHAVSLS